MSLSCFRLKFVRPVANNVFELNNLYCLKLSLGLSHLRYQTFKHKFRQDCINPICVCDLEIETATHLLLHCLLFQSARQSL